VKRNRGLTELDMLSSWGVLDISGMLSAIRYGIAVDGGVLFVERRFIGPGSGVETAIDSGCL